VHVTDVSLSDVALCCDLERHVFYAAHTDPGVAEALRQTHWFRARGMVYERAGRAARPRR
jgi:hypothetical protein